MKKSYSTDSESILHIIAHKIYCIINCKTLVLADYQPTSSCINLTDNATTLDLPQLANDGANSTGCTTDNKCLPFLGGQELKETKVSCCSVAWEIVYLFT